MFSRACPDGEKALRYRKGEHPASRLADSTTNRYRKIDIHVSTIALAFSAVPLEEAIGRIAGIAFQRSEPPEGVLP